MVDITSVLNLQGRARRNARSSLRRLQRERDAAREAAAALHAAQLAAGVTDDPPDMAAVLAVTIQQ